MAVLFIGGGNGEAVFDEVLRDDIRLRAVFPDLGEDGLFSILNRLSAEPGV